MSDADDGTCKHCGGEIAIRNPTGSCDHLFWPDQLTDEAKRANGYKPTPTIVWMKENVRKDEMIRMQEHILKTLPAYFDAVRRGEKPFEVRRDDRGFQKGDILVLQRTREDRPNEVETRGYGLDQRPAHELRKRVGYVLTGGQLGIEPGYVVMALEDVD